MQKDVIYIDVEDDITAIIGKVKASNAPIVALVPPKRLGAIQSAVNLKLVNRAAEQADKRLVLISNNPALVALAASASIPVAKNLQSKPELAEVSALEVDEGEDVIDGSDIPGKAAAVASIESAEAEPSTTTTAAPGAAITAARKSSGSKIPNFDSFRKKLFIGIGAGIFLIAFLVWALVFAPTATIIVTARTSTSALTTKVSVGDSLSTSLKDGTIKSTTKTLKKEVSTPVTATGTKNVGEKAKGTVKFTTTNPSGVNIPAGTALTVAGMTFSLDAAVAVPGATLSFSCGGICPGTANGTIVAPEGGQKYNGASGTVTGAPSGVSASTVGSTSGGTDKTATIVQQSDVEGAMTTLVSNEDSAAAEADLKDDFGDEYVVLKETFKKDTADVKSAPAVDAEAADGKATLAGEVKFTMVAVSRTELNKFLDEYYAQQIDGKTDQKVYDNGAKGATFTGVSASDKGYSANIAANGKIGPKIDEEALKNYAKGKRYGEIQSYVQDINGVDNVDVKFAPFWVQSAPNDTKKIQVEFKVNE